MVKTAEGDELIALGSRNNLPNRVRTTGHLARSDLGLACTAPSVVELSLFSFGEFMDWVPTHPVSVTDMAVVEAPTHDVSVSDVIRQRTLGQQRARTLHSLVRRLCR